MKTTSQLFIVLFISLTVSSILISAVITLKNNSDSGAYISTSWYGTTANNATLNNPYSNQSYAITNTTACPPGDWICGIVAGGNAIIAILSMMVSLLGTIFNLVVLFPDTADFPLWANILFIKTQFVALIFTGIFAIRGV